MPRKVPTVRWALIGLALLGICIPIDAQPTGRVPDSNEPEPPPGERVPIENGKLLEFTDDKPNHWRIDVGARDAGSGKTARSQVKAVAGGGVRLEGGATTREWSLLTNTFSVESGTTYQVRFEAQTETKKRATDQRDNRYVGLRFQTATGQSLGFVTQAIYSSDWSPGFLTARAPDRATTAQVMIFLSHTGSLSVRNIDVRALAEGDSARVLFESLSRYYSFWNIKKIDPREFERKHRLRIEAAQSAPEFARLTLAALRELEDLHVWVQPEGAPLVPTFRSPVSKNYDYRAVSQQLEGVVQHGKIGFSGRTPDGFGYLAIGTLSGRDNDFKPIQDALRGLMDCPGVLLDLRSNSGGNEIHAQRLASMLTERRVSYARTLFRSGPKPADLSEVEPRSIAPATVYYGRPVVALIGPECMSSGEGFALMLKALPRVQLVGLPTRGASGNPGQLTLPNGVSVYFSRWQSLMPDGTPIEGAGVPPDVRVDPNGKGDPTFMAGLKLLREASGGQ